MNEQEKNVQVSRYCGYWAIYVLDSKIYKSTEYVHIITYIYFSNIQYDAQLKNCTVII